MSMVDFSDPATIALLAAALQTAGVDGIEIDQPARKVRIVVERGAPGAAPRVQVSQPNSPVAQSGALTAPMAGVFGSRHPGSVASTSGFPRVVAVGETLGFVRVGPVLLPVRTSEAGVLTRSVVADGSVVGYGDPLFEIEPRP